MRIWTERERKRQACVARRHHPWTRSTGPRTKAGKERSKYNAMKHGFSSRLYRDMWLARRSYKRFIRKFLPFFTFERLRKHMIYEFELLSMLVALTIPKASDVKFTKNSLRQWIEKVEKETLYDYKTLYEQTA